MNSNNYVMAYSKQSSVRYLYPQPATTLSEHTPYHGRNRITVLEGGGWGVGGHVAVEQLCLVPHSWQSGSLLN